MDKQESYKKQFAKNLQKIMANRGKTQVDIIKDLHITRSSISAWVCGTRMPRMDKIDLLSRYFNCTAEELLQGTAPESDLISLYNQLNPEGQSLVIEYASGLVALGKYKKPNKHNMVG